MGYGHRYYSDAERLKAVKGYMNAGMTAEEYGKQIGKMKLTTSLGCARELLSKEIYDLLRQDQ